MGPTSGGGGAADAGGGPASTSGGGAAAAAAAAPPPEDAAAAVRAALTGVVDRPSLYLVRAAQATTLRQLKAARKRLRDVRTAAQATLGGQLAGGLEAAAADLGSLRADLDAVAAALRQQRQQLSERCPDLARRLAAAAAGDDGDEE